MISTQLLKLIFGMGTYSTYAGPSQSLKIRGGHVVLGGDNVPPLVEIGLTDLPKTGGGGGG
jgi:hypothetical protein